MTHRSDFKRLFRESFADDASWLEWFMERVYDDNNLLTLDSASGKPASMMLMSPYSFMYQGEALPSAYISCVATAKAERGQGLMHKLMLRALNACAERGDALASLIPADRRLYFLYDSFGFATVYYTDELRYTSLHAFTQGEEFTEVDPDYSMFRRLESLRPCSLRHTDKDYSCIVDDLRLSSGQVLAVSNGSGGEAMAFVSDGHEAKVADLLSSDDDACEAVLAAVRAAVGEKSIVVLAEPGGRRAALRARGMMRILNVEMVLGALAAAHPDVDQTIRVHDAIIGPNNSIFTVRKGVCERTPGTMRRISLDVEVDVLAKILFSDEKIGEIFGIPSVRPFISLMLD